LHNLVVVVHSFVVCIVGALVAWADGKSWTAATARKVGNNNDNNNDSNKESDEEEVVVLTDSNWDKLVNTTEDIWMIDLYATWCGHCKSLAPEWSKAASMLAGM
jgi:thiol-disulfide isomerase/thioredoxin